MNIKTYTLGSVAIALILLLAINIFSNATFRSARVDLTENNLFTLSDGTHSILEKLEEPVTMRFYLSQKLATRLPGISSYANRVKELLLEYKRIAGSNLNLSVIDPEPFSETEDEAVAYGLKGVPLQDGESTFYFGLVATGPTDEESVIAFFAPDRQEFVEYDVTKIIQQVANPKKKVIGLLSTISIDGSPAPHMPGMGMMPRPTETWMVVEHMRQFFKVDSLDPDIDEIPAGIDVLMLVHPKQLADKTLYAIDQYVLKGGRLLAFVDPHAETDSQTSQQTGMPGSNFGASDLNKLTNAWGVKTSVGKIVGDIQLAQKVAFNFAQRNATIDYPVWMKLPEDQLNKEDIITSDLGTVNVATPGNIEVTPTENVQVVPLMSTTEKATTINKAQLGIMSDPQELLRNYKPNNASYTLAARITGKVKSAFPNGKPESGDNDAQAEKVSNDENGDNKSETAQSSHLAESTEAINVILVADTDFLEDRFWVRIQNLFGSRVAVPIAANGSFVINALDNLMGSNDLISVRNRGHFSRPFTLVNEIRQDAEVKFREKEQELLKRLRDTERKLVELQSGKSKDSEMIFSPEQKVALETFREEKVQIRKDLRKVRHQLQQDIDSLEGWTKFLNIGFIPILIGIIGITIAVVGYRKRNTAARSNTAIS